MALSGYNIDVAGCSGLLARVRDNEEIPAAAYALDNAYGQAVEGCGSPAVAGALTAVHIMVAQQAQAAAARIQNAVDGVSQAVNAYIAGDMAMAETARRSVDRAPDLEPDDSAPNSGSARGILAVY